MKPMFDFQLWEPSRDLCFSDPANGTQCLHWFALTFADYCMNFGNVTLFQYTKEVLDSWKMPSSNKEQKLSRCDDYQIAGVLQPDFDGVLGYVGEPLPEDFRQITQSTKELLAYRRKYDNLNDSLYVKLEEDFPDDCQNPEKETREDEIYHYEETLIHWLSHRRWWQWYLTNSLQIWFFRYGDDIQIVWDTALAP